MITDTVVYCPIRRCPMVEVAEGIFQCNTCMFGPSTHGYGFFYCVTDLELVDEYLVGNSIHYEPATQQYRLHDIWWKVDGKGHCMPGSLGESVLGVARQQMDLVGLPLPVVVLNLAKWDWPPAMPRLWPFMFPRLGEKYLELPERKLKVAPSASR
jgi:hypothetical protein